MIFWTFRTEGVYRAVRHSDDLTDVKLIFAAKDADGLAFDERRGKLYVTVSAYPRRNADQLLRMNPDGTEVEKLASNLDFTGDIVVDSEEGRLYLSHIAGGKITRLDVDGKNPVEVVKGLVTPNELALDARHRKLYWASDGRIQRANLDGRGVEEVTKTPRGPMGIVLDEDAQWLYYAVASDGTIRRIRLDGKDAKTIVTGLAGVDGVALDTKHGKLYWTDSVKIAQSDLDGGQRDDLVGGKTYKWASLVVVPPLRAENEE